METKKFKRFDLKLPQPKFGGELTSLVLELEHLRRLQLEGTTNPYIFFQLKKLFHTLESIGSARIEGNNTTISQFIETQLEDRPFVNEKVEEIRNIERAMRWVDEIVNEQEINRGFISELHKIIVSNLTPPPDGEGDYNPGNYRKHQVEINGTDHIPPPGYLVEELMDELLEFINKDVPAQYDLLKIATAHHRFMWIHPFGNGNGRTGRLFTYAMLVKTGFQVNIGQILNPTAVFCIDRDKYYELLSKADTGNDSDIENWSIYVLSGLKNEIEKIEKLTDEQFVLNNLLLPSLSYSLKMKYIDEEEFSILKTTAQKKVIQAGDLKSILKGIHQTTISRKIRSLRDKKMLEAESKNGNKYHLNFVNNFLIRGMINALGNEGYIPLNE
ncbi:Fic family protein [Aquimarina gracilis]|uniref:Fic family protein n=1 Tax=Aquimarina gracilis TaxID=874422 RepID=A0ABU5ZQC4_9FLAO|nr:Fic family protein [Aquimarina gracilis]MEB3344279.1 Fic family protein [Aquimarina gracilis]